MRHPRRGLRGPDRGHRGDQPGDDPDVQPVAVITGASSGIGAALARKLAERGWRCVLVARRRDRLERFAAELGAEAEVCDVSSREQVERTAGGVLARHPRVKLLVNNAGIPGRASFLGTEPEAIEHVLRTNYLGSVWCLRSFLPALEAAAPADVVNVVSVAGVVAYPPSGPYAASKHAQLAFSRATAAQLAPRGIRVHAVLPGLVHTEGFPNRKRFGGRLARRLVADPDPVADRILSALARGRRESFVPSWYRMAALVQALAPGVVARWFENARFGTRFRRGR